MREQTRELETLRRDAAAAASAEPYHRFAALTGRSPAMLELKRHLDRLVQVPWPVLIEGESGAGKELVARELHRSGPRRRRPFVVENCAAIPEPLLEAELFGARKGAFTGAIEDRPGLFEVANGGTLFLDEIAEMSLAMQAKVLRAIDTGEVRPVGARRSLRFDVRIIAATNKDLRAEVEAGRFREDLYYRLHVLAVRVPPLRERRDDIPLLVECFLDRIARETASARKQLAPGVLEVLMAYHWPGNVRELLHEVQRAAALADKEITVRDLSPQVRGGAIELNPVGPVDAQSLQLARLEAERKVLMAALAQTGNNRTQAAKLLGISRYGLQKRLKRCGLK
ncbi:MAG: hypothetical protein KatS3mg102_1918 [Planctomycetota bacterium]|nr:MAG: hypothetical protein KatS3mg102_1918 [Planctomycetota bacterium]